MLKGAWTPGKRRHLGAQPELEPGERPGAPRPTPTDPVYQEGLDTQTVAQQLMADGDTGRVSVSLGSAPPAIQQHITAVASLEERSVNPRTGVVDYLVPNVRSKVFADEKVRLALAAATNRDAYVTAIGGATAADPALSLVPQLAAGRPRVRPGRRRHPGRRREGQGPAHPGRGHHAGAVHRGLPVEPDGRQGDGGARGRLAPGRVRPDRPRRSPTTTSRRSATRSWPTRSTCSGRTGRRPGPRPRRSCRRCSTARSTSPRSARGATTATGPTRSSTPGWRRSTRSPTRAAREKAWADIDASLLAKGAYIGLAERRALYMAGSDVRNLSANTVAGGVVEFADIAVAR